MAYRNYSTANSRIVDPSGNGDFKTITAAIAAGGTKNIVLLPGTYTENFTLPANINLVSYTGSGNVPTVTIVGKITCSDAGTRSISGVRLQSNSDNIIAITGTANTVVNLNYCYVNVVNNVVGLSCSSSGSCVLNLRDCTGDLTSATASYFAFTSGTINFFQSYFVNSSSSTTINTLVNAAASAAFLHTTFNAPVSTSTSAVLGARFSNFGGGGLNATMITIDSANNSIRYCIIGSGTASAISIATGADADIYKCAISSSNTNAITGLGTINFGDNTFFGSSSVINTTTQTAYYTTLGKYKASQQPSFSAYNSSGTANVTGDGTNATVTFDTELFDVGNNFASSTFTAPVTGKYWLYAQVLAQQVVSSMTGTISITTTSTTYTNGNFATTATGNFPQNIGVLCQMTAGDTATVQINFGGGTKVVDVYGGASDPRTHFCGYLVG